MLVILNNNLFKAQFTPVIPDFFHVEYDPQHNRLELFHNRDKVELGVTWYAFSGQIDPKTGVILQKPTKSSVFRAVFGKNHLDFTFPA